MCLQLQTFNTLPFFSILGLIGVIFLVKLLFLCKMLYVLLVCCRRGTVFPEPMELDPLQPVHLLVRLTKFQFTLSLVCLVWFTENNSKYRLLRDQLLASIVRPLLVIGFSVEMSLLVWEIALMELYVESGAGNMKCWILFGAFFSFRHVHHLCYFDTAI